MRKRVVLPALACAAIACAASQAAVAGSKHAPLGYLVMCLNHPAACQGGGAHQVMLSEDALRLIRSINSAVNRAIRPRSDKGADHWDPHALAKGEGDCEDFVLAKRAKLIAAGMPPSALRIAHVKTRRGEGHAVLVVNTDRGKLVLDNVTPAIKRLDQTGYRIVAMQTADARHWK